MWRVKGSDHAAQMLRDALTTHARDPDPVDWPLRTLFYARDQLRQALNTPADLDAWRTTPSPTGSQEWDTLLATVIAHEFTQRGQAAPTWATGQRLRRAWTPSHPIWTQAQVQERTPDWLKAAGIYMPEKDLETA